MSTVLVGARTLRRSCAWVVAMVVAPVGSMKILVDRVSECRNGSWRVPAVEVVPVSLTAEGMVPLMIPCLMAAVDMRADLLRVVLECFWWRGRDVCLWLHVLVRCQCLLYLSRWFRGRVKWTCFVKLEDVCSGAQ